MSISCRCISLIYYINETIHLPVDIKTQAQLRSVHTRHDASMWPPACPNRALNRRYCRESRLDLVVYIRHNRTTRV